MYVHAHICYYYTCTFISGTYARYWSPCTCTVMVLLVFLLRPPTF